MLALFYAVTTTHKGTPFSYDLFSFTNIEQKMLAMLSGSGSAGGRGTELTFRVSEFSILLKGLKHELGYFSTHTALPAENFQPFSAFITMCIICGIFRGGGGVICSVILISQLLSRHCCSWGNNQCFTAQCSQMPRVAQLTDTPLQIFSGQCCLDIEVSATAWHIPKCGHCLFCNEVIMLFGLFSNSFQTCGGALCC